MGRVRKKHPREFKIAAVRKLQSGEVSLAELSRRLSVSASEVCKWRKLLEEKKGDAFPGHGKGCSVPGLTYVTCEALVQMV